MMFRFAGFAVVAAVGVFLAGCSSAGSSSGEGTHDGSTRGGERASVPDSTPHITGVITADQRAPGTEASLGKRILVEENPEGCVKDKSDKGCNKLYLSVTQKTLILRKAGGEEAFSQARAADLERGQRVRAWHTGVLTKSYPGQGSAQVIVIDATNAAPERTASNSGLIVPGRPPDACEKTRLLRRSAGRYQVSSNLVRPLLCVFGIRGGGELLPLFAGSRRVVHNGYLDW